MAQCKCCHTPLRPELDLCLHCNASESERKSLRARVAELERQVAARERLVVEMRKDYSAHLLTLQQNDRYREALEKVITHAIVLPGSIYYHIANDALNPKS